MSTENENIAPVKIEPKILYDFTDRNLKNLEKDLASSLIDKFKSVRLGFTRFGSVCLTAWPQPTDENLYPDYRMFFRSKIQKENFNLETLKDVILLQIENSTP